MAALFGKHVAAGRRGHSRRPLHLQMATINGARALGLGDEIGSLVAGKAADMICVELTAPAVRPVLDPLSQLVYSAGREHVTDTWVAGEHLLAEGRHTRLDVDPIIERAEQWGRQVLES